MTPSYPAEDDDEYARFDAIVTDPPYGLMEGLGKQYLPLQSVWRCYWTSPPNGSRLTAGLSAYCHCRRRQDAEEVLPLSRLPLRAYRSSLSASLASHLLRMHRLMLTLVKVAEPSNVVVEQEVRAAEERSAAKIGAMREAGRGDRSVG